MARAAAFRPSFEKVEKVQAIEGRALIDPVLQTSLQVTRTPAGA